MRSYLHIVAFIILNFTADCGARIHVVYKSIGEKAHLTLKEDRNITTVKWRKDQSPIAIVENQKQVTRYPEKFHIHVSDNSLFIHNLTVNDSGQYRAETGQWEEEIIIYHLIVQEAVSTPVIDASLNHQSNSSSVCHILVKCSADGDSVTYDCDHQHCTQTNATSIRLTITINYTNNGVLECIASNRVSTKRTSISMSNTCSEKQPVQTKQINYILVLIIIISCTVVFGVLMICAIKLFYNNRKKEQNEGTYQEDKGINTVYSVVRKQPRTETPADSGPAENATATVYDVPSKCARAPQSHSDDCVQKDDTHTVYWKLGQTQEA
ncbi:hypothetical protein PHYPO_G00190650 [Pangasianodon hypophthalmus]|uniref:Ig-like domain-containing protein n=1 Tax=Pangasianodon hypophthalmus TaxID=310915 RepID=A0A5N5PJ69_PANHP|nr:uncharacterized protein si:ch1073-220m6.1 [Pangasianodon hypophthalmus]KAB5579083.1 hypothetical protein PHYPO_G00190650 [Pangasianodon hypophthalmus]